MEHFARYLSSLLASIATDSTGDSITHLVDFGSGQSYLSRILASPPHNLDLVAVESKASNIEAGKVLDKRVGLTAKSLGKTLKQSLDTDGEGVKKGSIQYVQHVIKDESMKEVLEALQQSGESESPTKDPGLMIISLHSCGNLIHHAINALLANDEVKGVAVVGMLFPPPYPPYSFTNLHKAAVTT